MEAEELLFRALVCLSSVEECRGFLEDLLTPAEVHTFAQRMAVAAALAEGATYEEAMRRTGASSATISRVRRSLFDGDGGYQLVLRRMKESGEAPEV